MDWVSPIRSGPDQGRSVEGNSGGTRGSLLPAGGGPGSGVVGDTPGEGDLGSRKDLYPLVPPM